jgi:hypothetical protein
VPDRLIFVPVELAAPPAVERIPGIRAALDEFRAHFDVDVFDSPTHKGEYEYQPDLEGWIGALRDTVAPGCHIVAMGAQTGLILMALDADDRPASLTCAGFSVPPATLESLGMSELASSARMMFLPQLSTYQYVRLVMDGADEETWSTTTQLIDEHRHHQRSADYWDSYSRLDLVRQRPRISCPTLYLDSPLPVAGFADVSEVFLNFVPHASVERLDMWPRRLHEDSTGHDLSRRVLAFIERLNA